MNLARVLNIEPPTKRGLSTEDNEKGVNTIRRIVCKFKLTNRTLNASLCSSDLTPKACRNGRELVKSA